MHPKCRRLLRVTMAARCIDCRRLVTNLTRSRCPTCATRHRAKYHGDWPTHARTTIAAYLATSGPHCPGWQRPAHTVNAADLTLDHELGPLCRACNSAKRDRG